MSPHRRRNPQHGSIRQGPLRHGFENQILKIEAKVRQRRNGFHFCAFDGYVCVGEPRVIVPASDKSVVLPVLQPACQHGRVDEPDAKPIGLLFDDDVAIPRVA